MGKDKSDLSWVVIADEDGNAGTSTKTGTAAAADVDEPAAATAAVVTYAAVADVKHVIRGVAWSYDAAPASGNLTIEDVAGTTVLSVDITAAGPGFLSFTKKAAAVNTAMIITLASGGGAVVGKVNVLEHWTE